jgi:hypothetical protein
MRSRQSNAKELTSSCILCIRTNGIQTPMPAEAKISGPSLQDGINGLSIFCLRRIHLFNTTAPFSLAGARGLPVLTIYWDGNRKGNMHESLSNVCLPKDLLCMSSIYSSWRVHLLM